MTAPSTSAKQPARAARHGLVITISCGVAYLATLELFLAIPMFNGATQIRPASGLAPVLGLLFGLPGALGCAGGNLISDLIHWPDDPALPLYFLVQLAYAYGLRALWRLTFKDNGLPRLKSAAHIAVFLVGALADATLITLLLMPFEFDTMQALNIHVVRLLNNFLAMVYVGTPVMLLVERLRRDRGERSLSERFALIALGMTALASMLCVSVMLAFEGADAAAGKPIDFDELIGQLYLMLTGITVCLFGLACAMLAVLERALARPLHELAADARTLAERMEKAGPQQMRDGALDVRLSPVHVLDEIALVATESNQMRHALGKSILDAQAATREAERVATELSVASIIQANALPTDFRDLESHFATDIEAIMRPARTVGGDFYDVFPLDQHRVCALVADVSDKGVPAALFMMRAMTEARECLRSAGTLGEGLSHANAHLCANNDAMLFVTMFAVALDTRSGAVEFANAGHNLPIFRSPIRGNRWLKAKAGLPLGVIDDYFYEDGQDALLPGEQLILYTDGVTEARSASGELFGDARLFELLDDGLRGDESTEAAHARSARSAVQAIEQEVARFSDGTEQADDLTALSLTWLPQGAWAHFEAIPELCPQVCAFGRSRISTEAAESVGFGVDLIIEELFVNVASHAYKDAAEQNPGVNIYIADDTVNHMVHLVIEDRGVAYDPTARDIAPLDGTEEVDTLQPGGLGILLTRKLSDIMRYERLGERNILHVIKTYGL